MGQSNSKGLLSWAAVIFELTKAKITGAVTLSVATGHFLFTETFSTSVILPALGVFLLACGSAALNQVQEARLDSKMTRTRRRPIPSGKIPVEWALFVSLAFICAGIYLLSCIKTHTVTLLCLAGLAVIWYNGIYILLKRITAFAVVPGALVGSIPPLIGWAAGGGMITDPAILEVAFFFFIWQIPHFWLLLLIHGKDYEEAGLPSLTAIFSTAQISRITCMWMLAAAATGLLMSVAGKTGLPWNVGILAFSVWLGMKALGFLKAQKSSAYFPAFMQINGYAFFMMILLICNAIW
jgi:protoheme IX farnesyltransferase